MYTCVHPVQEDVIHTMSIPEDIDSIHPLHNI